MDCRGQDECVSLVRKLLQRKKQELIVLLPSVLAVPRELARTAEVLWGGGGIGRTEGQTGCGGRRSGDWREAWGD